MQLPSFRKASPIASMQTCIAKLRKQRDALAEQLSTTETNISQKQERSCELLLADTPDHERAKVRSQIADAELLRRDLVAAIAKRDDEIVKAEANLAATVRQQEAEAAVSALQADNEVVVGLMAQLTAIAAELLPAARRLSRVNWDAGEIEAVAKLAADDLPGLAARVSATTKWECDRLLSGAARPKPQPVVQVSTPAPVPTRCVLALADISWPGGTAAQHDQCNPPLEWAAVAVRLGYALEMTDGRWKSFYSGGKATPSRAACVDLADPNLKPRKQAMGNDIALQRAKLVESIDGKQVQSFAQRG